MSQDEMILYLSKLFDNKVYNIHVTKYTTYVTITNKVLYILFTFYLIFHENLTKRDIPAVRFC